MRTKLSTYLIVGILLLMLPLSAACRRHAKHPKLAPSPQENITYQEVSEPAGTVSELLEYPGLRISFNKEMKQPNWVAWELTRDEVRQTVTSRKNSNFTTDAKVKGCATPYDYKRSGYSRGHMCPAGDMRWSQEAMDACFMLTNICPQDYDLNSGAWQSLEDKCRNWAVRDSAIVIICGPVLTDSLTQKIGESQIPVPERFFKVILSPYSDPPRAIGFVMPNKKVDGGMQATAVSVDDVEAITGFDFFAALPDDIEDEIEAQCNFPRWSKR